MLLESERCTIEMFRGGLPIKLSNEDYLDTI